MGKSGFFSSSFLGNATFFFQAGKTITAWLRGKL
jgi:hypothetical protein